MNEMASPTTARERDYYLDPKVREQVRAHIESAATLFAGMGRGDPRTAFERGVNAVRGFRSELGSAFPDEEGYAIPEDGGWIIVKEPPHTTIKVPLWSIWRARPVYVGRDFKVVADRRRRTVRWPCLKARLATPEGDLDLWPEEYVPTSVEKWLDFIDNGVTVHFMGVGEPGELSEQLFYLQAHGIRRREALLLVLPSLEQEGFCYLTIDGA